ncbi:MAG: efflux RND transporter periplasmic adaptor subunit, partial [Psychromonas sp.]|nr:efflux RND transporter periplasmic adaptor subunit [Psychromonas sp.]
MRYLLILLTGLALGFLSGQSEKLTSLFSTTNTTSDPEILYWVAPMDANYRRDKAGKSPMGMDLVPVYAQAEKAEPKILYWVAPMDANYRRD